LYCFLNDRVSGDEIGWASSKCRGSKNAYLGFWWEIQKETDTCEDLDMGGKIIIKWIINKAGWYGMDLSGTVQEPVKGYCEEGPNFGKFFSN
jgi:hypothetical protein